MSDNQNVHRFFFLNVLNPAFIWRQLRIAFAFVLKPETTLTPNFGIYRNIVVLLALLIGLKFVQVIAIVIRVYSQDYGLMPALTNAVEQESFNWQWWQWLLAAGLIGPILEELAFRAHMRFSRILFSLSMGAAVYYILTQAVYGVRTHDLDTGLLVRVGGALGAGIICFVTFKLLPELESILAKFWGSQFPRIFWITALIFGLVHLGRYDLQWVHLPYIPLIIFPQVLSGFMYGFVRMRYGLTYSIGLHVFANSFTSLLANLGGA